MMVLILVGMEMWDQRKQQKATVLTRPKDSTWSHEEIDKLAMGLKPITCVCSHPKCPATIIIWGEHAREEIVKALGRDDFEFEVFQGLDNPKLPFRPGF